MSTGGVSRPLTVSPVGLLFMFEEHRHPAAVGGIHVGLTDEIAVAAVCKLIRSHL